MSQELLKHTSKLKLLFVEDDKILQETVQDLLQIIFGSVVIASDGEEGLALFTKEKFDIVIADIKMPKLNGFEMSQAIRLLDADVPIIIMSGEDEKDHIVEIFDVGIDGYLKKPLVLDRLYMYLAKIVNEKILDEEHFIKI